MKNLLSAVTKIRTPMTISGVAFVILYGIYRLILELNIFAKLNENNTFKIVSYIIDRVFILAIVALVLAMSSYIYSQHLASKAQQKRKKGPDVRVVDVSVDKPENRKN